MKNTFLKSILFVACLLPSVAFAHDFNWVSVGTFTWPTYSAEVSYDANGITRYPATNEVHETVRFVKSDGTTKYDLWDFNCGHSTYYYMVVDNAFTSAPTVEAPQGPFGTNAGTSGEALYNAACNN